MEWCSAETDSRTLLDLGDTLGFPDLQGVTFDRDCKPLGGELEQLSYVRYRWWVVVWVGVGVVEVRLSCGRPGDPCCCSYQHLCLGEAVCRSCAAQLRG